MPVEPQSEERFNDLTTVIDRLHERFEEWETARTFSPPASADSLEWLRLAVHEWIANLVQHADFQGRTPHVVVHVSADGRTLCCVVKDNSDGFDLEGSFPENAATRFEKMPDRGMGLLLVERIAETLDYAALSPHEHQLALTVRADADPVHAIGGTGDSAAPGQSLPHMAF